MNRRELLACLAVGGIITATGLWMPGEKKIFLPPNKFFIEREVCHEAGSTALWRNHTILELLDPDGSSVIIDKPNEPHVGYSEGTISRIWWIDHPKDFA